MDHMAEQIIETTSEDSRDRFAPAYIMWKQRDGTMIRIVDMDDRHLYNTIRMLERTAEARVKRLNADQISCDPDVPHYLITREQVIHRPIYHALLALAAVRGIDLSEAREENKWAEAARQKLSLRQGL